MKNNILQTCLYTLGLIYNFLHRYSNKINCRSSSSRFFQQKQLISRTSQNSNFIAKAAALNFQKEEAAVKFFVPAAVKLIGTAAAVNLQQATAFKFQRVGEAAVNCTFTTSKILISSSHIQQHHQLYDACSSSHNMMESYIMEALWHYGSSSHKIMQQQQLYLYLKQSYNSASSRV